jgi:hypothetical protein
MSLGTYLFSSACNLMLWKRNWPNDRSNAVFSQVFSFMQFLEFVIWLDIDGAKGWNRTCSVAIKPALFAQAGSLVLGHWIEHGKLPFFALWTIGGTVIAMCGRVLTDLAFLSTKPLVSVGPGGHLLWPSMEKLDLLFLACAYPMGMLFPITFYRPRFHGLLYTLTGPVSIVGTIVAIDPWKADAKEIGSVWCHIANLYSFVALFLPFVFGRDTAN